MAPTVRQTIVRRRRRPVFLIDASIPGDIEAKVNDLDGAFLYDLDELEAVASEGLAGRDGDAAAARLIVEEEVERFLRDRDGRDADPLVTALRAHFEAARRQALADAGDDPARATELLVNRLLHEPSTALRRMAEEGGASLEETRAMLARLFDMTDADKESER